MPRWPTDSTGSCPAAPQAAGTGTRWVGLVLATTVWTQLHADYNLLTRGVIFTYGLILAAVYCRSGSLWTPVAAHSAFLVIIATLSYLGPLPH